MTEVMAKSPEYEKFKVAIDDVLNAPLPIRAQQANAFLETLAFNGTKLSDFDKAAPQLPVQGGAYRGAQVDLTAQELYVRLSPAERKELGLYLIERARDAKAEIEGLSGKSLKVLREIEVA